MKCIDCKFYAGQISDPYGLCKRYPIPQNKTQQDWCGEFSNKFVTSQKEEIGISHLVKFVEETEYDIHTDEIKLKRGRKPKNAS